MSELTFRAFKRAVDQVGGYAIAGDIMGCSRQNVQQLIANRRECPPSGVIPLAKASGVPRAELRPDLYPPEDEAAPDKAAAA